MVIRSPKWYIFLATATLTTMLVLLISRPIKNATYEEIQLKSSGENHLLSEKEWRKVPDEKLKSMSVLGKILYFGENYPKPHTKADKYKILIWKYGKSIDGRHMKQFGSKFIDPFEGCSVNNCEITYEDSDQRNADMIIFHLHRLKIDDKLPEFRDKNQIWTFLTDESPYHTFLNKNQLTSYNNLFNWSMTYRMDSDIPVPYGRAISRTNHSPPPENLTITKRRDVLVAILGSNCGGKNNRWNYVRELQKHIQVDVYGGCGTLKTCPGHFRSNCHDIDSYLFYLAFENSNCDEYMTEKLWWNAYAKNSIPIVMGASKRSYAQLLPPNSYLNVDDYAHPRDLAVHLNYLNKTGNYMRYFQWRNDYQILNEHGYFGSKSWHYCRACEALNYNDRQSKVYTDLGSFWNTTTDCHPAWNSAN